jgi:hypothetical protein
MFPGGKGSRWVGLTTLPPTRDDCLEIWEPQLPGNLRACNGIALLAVTVKNACCSKMPEKKKKKKFTAFKLKEEIITLFTFQKFV